MTASRFLENHVVGQVWLSIVRGLQYGGRPRKPATKGDLRDALNV